ncbi:DNA polymerase III subunit tau [Candidatus Phycosocius bacilliformis]|uniref:DNA polymerase III subunit tau n=1 Tax=Candidatus Phycosocius bacilliformis TaxID=1445552 RepID=A0A2P2E807_9PROT|nr:DNA polymerase III subunit delta' [Candidatus Phycosocius bacilliformis]GBF57177.1 DNA polymerase III subunit tau [Candidatus Phycosocius bacilliformis]
MSEETLLPDQEPGSPHPRAVFELFGHHAAEAELADSLTHGRSHHAWLMTGPKGIGKATLAYRFARRLLGARPDPSGLLASDPDDPICRKIAQGAHPDLRTATRLDPEKSEIKRDVTIGAIRDLTQFFTMTADGRDGARVGIIDCADDMSVSAANALLKTLEEPPPGATLILLSHTPGRLLPTLRSRCRRLDLVSLSDADMAQALPDLDAATRSLAAGRPGRAKALMALQAAKLYATLSRHLSGLPRAPLDEALILAEASADADRFQLLFDMMEDWLARAGRAGVGLPIEEVEPGESVVLARLAAGSGCDGPARAWTHVRSVRTKAEALNLDRGLATLDALRAIRAELAPIQ